MTAITVELEDGIAERVRRYSEKKQMAVSDILANSLNKFLLMAELADLQSKLSGKAQEFGFENEEDLLSSIS